MDAVLTVGGLFDGCGLLAYGLHLAGLEHRWLCEIDPWRREILALRFPGLPISADVRDVGAGAERVDVVAGGFPCKGISKAGRREGFGHPETALWREMLRVVGELRPRYVLVENVADLLTQRPDGGRRGDLFGEVLGGLAESGYDAEWDCFPAAAFGAPHGRDRVFVTAVADAGWPGHELGRDHAPASESGRAREPADGGVHRGVPSGGDQAGRAPLPAGKAVALAADAQPDRPGAPADAERLGWIARSGLREGGPEPERQRRPADEPHEAVAWSDYAPAVERWEAISGRACPQPLVRRVDDGSAGRVDRSRLAALGDGVLVQAGWLVGRRIMLHAEQA